MSATHKSTMRMSRVAQCDRSSLKKNKFNQDKEEVEDDEKEEKRIRKILMKKSMITNLRKLLSYLKHK